MSRETEMAQIRMVLILALCAYFGEPWGWKPLLILGALLYAISKALTGIEMIRDE